MAIEYNLKHKSNYRDTPYKIIFQEFIFCVFIVFWMESLWVYIDIFSRYKNKIPLLGVPRTKYYEIIQQ